MFNMCIGPGVSQGLLLAPLGVWCPAGALSSAGAGSRSSVPAALPGSAGTHQHWSFANTKLPSLTPQPWDAEHGGVPRSAPLPSCTL